MKLVTFETGGERHIGALRPGETEIVDFTASDPMAPGFRDMLALIDGGADGWRRRRPCCSARLW